MMLRFVHLRSTFAHPTTTDEKESRLRLHREDHRASAVTTSFGWFLQRKEGYLPAPPEGYLLSLIGFEVWDAR